MTRLHAMRPSGRPENDEAPGGPSVHGGEAIPGPIPNPEVKLPIAQSTAVQSVGGQDDAGPAGGLAASSGARGVAVTSPAAGGTTARIVVAFSRQVSERLGSK